MQRWLLLITSFTPLIAADLAGLGEAIIPGTRSSAWLAWQNDGFGPSFGENSDDLRTNAIEAGATWSQLVVAANYSMLTQINPTGNAPAYGTPNPYAPTKIDQRRCDELTTTAAWSFPLGTVDLRIGGGLRVAGNLGGETLQDEAHLFIGQGALVLPYERKSLSWTPLGYVRAGQLISLAEPLSLELRSLGLATGSGGYQAQLGARALISGPGGTWWTGFDQHLSIGETQTATQAGVLEGERGLWASAGFSFAVSTWNLGFSGARNLRNQRQDGSIMFAVDTDQLPALDGAWRGEYEMLIGRGERGGRGQAARAVRSFPDWSASAATWTVRDFAPSTPVPAELKTFSVATGPGLRVAWRRDEAGLTPLATFDASVQWSYQRMETTRWATVDDQRNFTAQSLVGSLMPGLGLGWRMAHGATFDLLGGIDYRLPFSPETVVIHNFAATSPTTVYTNYDLIATELVTFFRASAALSW